ncbi:alpha/beta hydrolase [Micromonospora sp. DT81.3]|uniref:alpha/beta hydrolase n=1 Tax=Micromonospora sp. DT81.3 TaxID=3416523 RepID=UPI003CEAF3D4
MKQFPSRVRRGLAVVAGLAAASIALSGCLYSLIPGQRTGPIPTATPDTDGVAAGLMPFYGQTLQWTDCDGFDCTMVTAPLNWADPSAGEVELSVIRQPATGGDAIGSLLTNPGGPGVSGVDLIRDSASFAVGERLMQDYDVIGFDPRGVGESTPVTCLDAAGMDAYLYDIPPAPRGTPEWEAHLDDGNRRFAEACQANSDGILEFITTDSAARDLDLLRAVLGDEKLNYLGYSYGTFLGATYAELFPDRVGRMVLDGAVDPSTSLLEAGTTQALGFESALRAYMRACLAGSECPFRGTVDEAMADIGALLASVDRSPMQAADGREVGADTMLTGIVYPLYSQGSWEFLTGALVDALAGDPEAILFSADGYNDRANGVYVANFSEAFHAYNCMDYPVDWTAEDEAAAEAILEDEAPTIAPYWNLSGNCGPWPYPPTGTRGPIAAAGAAPILVIGTTNDPATPYEWAVALAGQLDSGVLVTRVGEGHTGFNKGNACVDDAVEAYLLEGNAPAEDIRCE